MADHRTYFFVFLLFLTSFQFSSYAYQFNVGGRDGWVVNPSENYNQWAGRMRFQVNDTLLFKYKKGSDSVLVVNKDDYNNCNIDKPITKLEDGNSIFKLDRSGPFYFISGNKSNCDHGQKLIIVVLAVRTPPKGPPAPAGKSPVSSPPARAPAAISPTSPTSPAPAPAAISPTSPTSPAPAPAPISPAPEATSPAPSTAPTPAESPLSPPTITPSPSPSSSPVTSPPSASPSTSPSASPSSSPVTSPPSASPSTSPVTSPPALSPPPSSKTPGSPGLSPPGTIAPPTNNTPPADINSPPAGSSTRLAFTAPSALLTSTLSLLFLSVTLGASIFSFY